MSGARSAGWKGAPLALFAILLSGWVAGRAVLWEAPFASELPRLVIANALPPAPGERAPLHGPTQRQPIRDERADLVQRPARPGGNASQRVAAAGRSTPAMLAQGAGAVTPAPPPVPVSPITPGLRPSPPREGITARPKRWSLDAWGFWRQGSDAAPIAQSRVPIYGASQIGAIAQYRLAPSKGSDPRAYARAYRAMVPRGESELALGASLRPLARLPVRAFAEVRYTDAEILTEWRPALFVVSELPPQPLPGGFQLEAYGQAGWVGGEFATGFADGQVVAVREVTRFAPFGGTALRLSAGAGAWGGIQRDASRVDVGPSVRFEWTMGRVPARLSVDWREQVSGDAAPQSGLAATLATGF